MRLRKNIRAPTRYEDIIAQPTSSLNASVTTTTRKGPPGTIPAFEIPFTPYNPTLVQRKPAAFPSRDLTVNCGQFENGPEARQLHDSLLLQSSKQSLRKRSHLHSHFSSHQRRLLLFRPHSLRAILATSLQRSDSTTKLPRRQAGTRTVRRRLPPPDPLVANKIPYFADAESNEPRLEEVWDVFNRNSPSFLNQAVDAPPHGIRDLIKDRRKGPNYLRKMPVLDLPFRGTPSVLSLEDAEVEPVAEHGQVERRNPLQDEPLHSQEPKTHDTTDWCGNDDFNDPVNGQNGSLYDIELMEHDFLRECVGSDNKQHVLISGQTLRRFDDLAAQLAIDIYCQIYFEAKGFRVNASRICRMLLDLTVESDEHMHWVIAKRLLDKTINFNNFLVPDVDLHRDVLPNASPRVSSFTCPIDRRYLGLKDVDWNYVSHTDLEEARVFLTQHDLPQSLLRDWTDEPDTSRIPQSRNSRSRCSTAQPPHRQEQRSRAPRTATPTQSEPRGSRKRRQPDSGSEYQDEGDDGNLNNGTSAANSRLSTPTPHPRRPAGPSSPHQQPGRAQQEQQQEKPTTQQAQHGGEQAHAQTRPRQPHAPPRPSFARPGSHVAQAPLKAGTGGPSAARKEEKGGNAAASAGLLSESSGDPRPRSRSGVAAGSGPKTRGGGAAAAAAGSG
ncbi:MAG: hypothetical protein Q9157_004502, partial [Trypethelium eluteriae]